MQQYTQSSVKVYQAADVQDIAVIVQLQHPDVAALQVGHCYAVDCGEMCAMQLSGKPKWCTEFCV